MFFALASGRILDSMLVGHDGVGQFTGMPGEEQKSLACGYSFTKDGPKESKRS